MLENTVDGENERQKLPGLSERIKIATDRKEIDALLAIGATYQAASPKTRRKWNARARARMRQLELAA